MKKIYNKNGEQTGIELTIHEFDQKIGEAYCKGKDEVLGMLRVKIEEIDSDYKASMIGIDAHSHQMALNNVLDFIDEMLGKAE